MEENRAQKRKGQVLVVEDDEAQMRTLTDIFQDEGFDVTGCCKASEALYHLQHFEAGVVVLDLNLGDLNGTELLERLDGVSDKVRVVINTGFSSYESAKDALNLGAFAYVEKAGDPEELLRHVYRAFQASLRCYAEELEAAVERRTQELLDANEMLKAEVEVRRKSEAILKIYQAQLKSLTSELALIEEQERRRIAEGLHDHVSQALVFCKVKLEKLGKSDVSEKVKSAVDEVCEIIKQTIVSIKALTFDLSSAILYDLGLEAAIEDWLSNQVKRKYGIQTEFTGDGSAKGLDESIKVILFRNVRELLINTIKHAHAGKIRVSSHEKGEAVEICVEDDGAGFDASQMAVGNENNPKYGLFSIRERIENIGGQLTIDTAVGHGCRVTMLAPLKSKKLKGKI